MRAPAAIVLVLLLACGNPAVRSGKPCASAAPTTSGRRPRAPRLVETISLPTKTAGILVHPSNGALYALVGPDVLRHDPRSGRWSRHIRIGQRYTPRTEVGDDGRLLVLKGEAPDGRIDIYELASGRRLGRIPVPGTPVAVTTGPSLIVVGSEVSTGADEYGPDRISILAQDDRDFVATADIAFNSGNNDIALGLDEGADRIYAVTVREERGRSYPNPDYNPAEPELEPDIIHEGGEISSHVFSIDTTGTIVDEWEGGDAIFGASVTVDPRRHLAYLDEGTVTAYDMTAGCVIKHLDTGPGDVGGVAVDLDRNLVYVATSRAHTGETPLPGPDNVVTVYDGRTFRPIKRFPLRSTDGAGAPSGLTIDRNRGTVYVQEFDSDRLLVLR